MNSLSQRTITSTPHFIVHSLQRPRSYRPLWKSMFITARAKALQWTLFLATWMQSSSHIILVKSQLSCYPSICGCFNWSLPPSCTVEDIFSSILFVLLIMYINLTPLQRQKNCYGFSESCSRYVLALHVAMGKQGHYKLKRTFQKRDMNFVQWRTSVVTIV
jgi:hypothetical protein